ncbi:YycH family regulatory protein [Virgibacillus kekensis]|uniref:YycH family regulatory protein n=1 Tax=Virgibacillus kekensis TaxID=202261 RepID=A0ABV9DKX9_9BACI
MKWETVKSFILTALVGLSLLLTFGLWNYQPRVENVNSSDYEEQVDLGGLTETKQSVIEPSNYIFHSNGTPYGFTNPLDERSLYQNMQNWVLYGLRFEEGNNPPVSDYQVEIVFPEALSMELADSLFTFSEEVNTPTWRFKRIYITFNRNNSTLNVIFLSEDSNQKARATVNNSNKFDILWEYVTTFEGLSEYMRVDFIDEQPVYIPRHEMEITDLNMTIRSIAAIQLVDFLFPNPEIVSRNEVDSNEVYYTDDQRGMRVFQQWPSIVYEYPSQSEQSNLPVTEQQLIDWSLKNINEHKGWTDEYNLQDINTVNHTIRYQMYHDGYPVYSGANPSLSIIEQQWQALERTQELTQYSRPLFSKNNKVDPDKITLQSGSEVVSYLQKSQQYNVENISDIRIGYHLSLWEESPHVTQIYTMEPAWYIKNNGDWEKVSFSDPPILKGAG